MTNATNLAIEAAKQIPTSEQLKAQLLSVVQGAIDAGKNAIDFTYQQAPLLIEEIIKYAIWSKGSILVLALFIGLLGLYLNRVAVGKIKEIKAKNEAEGYGHRDFWNTEWSIMAIVPPLITTAVSLIIIWNTASDFIKALVAPRLYLIEYVAELVK